MKKFFVIALCALSLVACKKAEPFVASATYEANVFLSIQKSHDILAGGVPSARGYFENLVAEIDGQKFGATSFSAEDYDSIEAAYQKTDIMASELIATNKAKAEEIINSINATIAKTDLGSGDYTLKFTYFFGRDGKELDSFQEEIVYNGGTRMASDNVEFTLAGKECAAAEKVKFDGVEDGYTLKATGAPIVCLPDGTYADEATYGKIATVGNITASAEGDHYVIELGLNADSAHIAAIKKNAGDWHLLIPTNVAGEFDFIIYVPLKIVNSGI